VLSASAVISGPMYGQLYTCSNCLSLICILQVVSSVDTTSVLSILQIVIQIVLLADTVVEFPGSVDQTRRSVQDRLKSV